MSWLLAAGVVVSFGALAAADGSAVQVVFVCATTAFTGLTCYGLTTLVRLVRELKLARAVLAKLAVEQQRLQFAKDLHALLGARLSAIMAGGERILKFLDSRPEAARDQVTDMLTGTREALAEVRSVASGYSGLSLRGELATGRAALASAGVEPRIEPVGLVLPVAVDSVLGVVLREAVTNVLRHSDARWCAVAVDAADDHVTLTVRNDGAPPDAGVGSGIASLTRQVGKVNGELATQSDGRGTYTVRFTVPVDQQGRAGQADEHGLSGSPDTELPRMTRWLANGVLAAVLGGFGVIAVTEVVDRFPGPVPALTSVLYTLALLVLQVGYFGTRKVQPRSPATWVALAAQAALVFGPIAQFGEVWHDMPGFLAGTLLVVFGPMAGVPLFGLIIIGDGVQRLLFGQDLLVAINTALSATITGLVIYGLTRLARTAGELHATRNELAQSAVANERLRFARDVHDLLGLSLSAIALKAELANRLLMADKDKARTQLVETIGLARSALGEVRSVAAGYQQLSLAEELDSADAVLSSAEIDVHMEREELAISDPIGDVLALVVREGVTNVLRHSKAEHCTIRLGQDDGWVWLEIGNDGVPQVPAGGTAVGKGLGNMKHRIRAVGGKLVARQEQGTHYLVRATVPVDGPVTASRNP